MPATTGKRRVCTRCGKKNARPPARLCPTCKRGSKKATKAKTHEQRVVDTYGLEPGDYGKMMEFSNGTCFICGGKSMVSLAVDHDHKKEGKDSVRGILCRMCNRYLLGIIGKDDPERLERIMRAAIEYLRNPPAHYILGTNRGEE